MNAGVALICHSTKPRGGMVHTLSLAEELHRQGTRVHLLAMGDPDAGLFRSSAVPHTVLPAPPHTGTLTDRVFASIDTLTTHLSRLAGDFDILHTQDCIAARAAAAVRDDGAPVHVVRTVHHVDDFTTQALIDCQRLAIEQPDTVLVVSRQWQRILHEEYRTAAQIVPNGLDTHRFPPVSAETRRRTRDAIGAGERFVFLAVGGIEPRKGSIYLLEALAKLRGRIDPPPMLCIVGGHSFQDYAAYRDAALAALPGMGLELGHDVVLAGTLDDAQLAAHYAAADALAFPSVKEGFGLTVLEGIHFGLPVIATDLPVFREYLTDGDSALLPTPADSAALGEAMYRVATDPALRDRLRSGGRSVLPNFTWHRSARRHHDIYTAIRRTSGVQT